jgi:hypothetical protein
MSDFRPLRRLHLVGVFFFALFLLPSILSAQVTTGAMSGVVTSTDGEAVVGATVTAVHEPSQTQYGAVVREGGSFNISNMRVGGPYTVTVRSIGYRDGEEQDVYVNLNQTVRSDFELVSEAIEVAAIEVIAEQDPVLNSHRTGAATYVSADQVVELPSIRRSTRDLTRLDPRSDGNFSFGGKNWLYNNISLDGSYFNNPFGLDDPAPGGQTASEPVPFDAIEAVQVSIAPYDVRQSGFTGAAINSVTKSGTNQFTGTAYTFTRSESFIGDKVSGADVLNPDLSFNQTGFSLGGPLKEDKAFFFFNFERIRRDDPGTNFSAAGPGTSGAFVSRVQASDLEAISARMMEAYGYDTGPFEGYVNETNSDKFLAKLDWNINQNNHFIFRYNLLDAERFLPPHPFAISINNTGRGPNENSLPFQNSGYAINNELNSFVWELNTQAEGYGNRLFASYNRFRDFRAPNSPFFPTLEIGVDGVTYTTVGHEPFSINNLLDQDVFQMTEELSLYSGNHVYTLGTALETFKFNNSFNLFFFGVFAAPPPFGTAFSSLEEFFNFTDPDSPDFIDYNANVEEALQNDFGFDPFHTGQWAVYAQDEYRASDNLNLTFGLRMDLPLYFTDLAPTPISNALLLQDENGNPEEILFDEFPDTQVLWSPRVGFNWDAKGDRSTQIRGGTGIFSGRVPFVWLSNQATNQGPDAGDFDLNASVSDLKWPQVWRTNIAVDQLMPGNSLLTLELLYGNNINDVFIRNPNLADPIGTLPAPDGRVRYDPANNRLNGFLDSGGDIYVLDNTGDGYDVSFTAQLRKLFENGLSTSFAYNFTEAKNRLDSTEIAAFIFAGNPIAGDPNNFDAAFSQFGHRHRITGAANYRQQWSDNWATSFGLFFEAAEGGFFTAGRTARYSYTYLGDLNGDGIGGNDLIYIPRDMSEMHFEPIPGGATPAQQATAFDAFIRQDPYLSEHRGEIAERNVGINPWFTNLDLRILQDFIIGPNTLEVSLDILNFGNLINSEWGVREVVNSAAKTPLAFNGNFDAQGNPLFQFPGTATSTFIDDISVISRWQMQLGFRYIFN